MPDKDTNNRVNETGEAEFTPEMNPPVRDEPLTEAQKARKGPIRRFLDTPPDNTVKTVVVALALCLVASMVVSAAAVSLRPLQEQNAALDKQVNIVEVAGRYEEGMDVAAAFADFEPHVVELATGAFADGADIEGQVLDPLTFDDRAAADDLTLSAPLDDDPAGIGRQANYVTVYLLRAEDGSLDKVILPVYGYGLWSTLYGFIAVEEDGNTIYGLQFYEHAETPGLGAEVDNPRWKALWRGKKLRDDEGDLKINVGKTVTAAGPDYHVDALSGATLTSRGVDSLVRFWMSERGFEPFLERVRAGEI
ncbi:Na+-transporting NADH:ubiquinone oxidoreductase subunit C [Maritimibacter alkaliphilus HTCC2654]|uniref:Na(+)-translocating NADH-quinone reductase subunit C n=1 Tax=Maritimibacter alkaliphilus HTCC2654 TaxID=314271 RepID=A3VFZ9_9RHOB|nr:Na(+)-translocating NADH-quinone reductase subunit C [Rhodobacterales bacterium HTCC2654] [Maritimibacter alkaliphilus HTCC2654]TYP78722.1 Na+-transporting NADH:ubiquinone oxidoreductase subunit C [Maritimibacter alkaliphilus HTCC2654]